MFVEEYYSVRKKVMIRGAFYYASLHSCLASNGYTTTTTGNLCGVLFKILIFATHGETRLIVSRPRHRRVKIFTFLPDNDSTRKTGKERLHLADCGTRGS